MAVAWHLAILDQRLAELEPELLRTWTTDRMTLAERKEFLFQRWDECDEMFTVDPADVPEDAILDIDSARVEIAEQARRRIEAFVRRHAPRGSKQGYTTAELKRLNARRVSREPFAPYETARQASARANR